MPGRPVTTPFSGAFRAYFLFHGLQLGFLWYVVHTTLGRGTLHDRCRTDHQQSRDQSGSFVDGMFTDCGIDNCGIGGGPSLSLSTALVPLLLRRGVWRRAGRDDTVIEVLLFRLSSALLSGAPAHFGRSSLCFCETVRTLTVVACDCDECIPSPPFALDLRL